MLLLASGRYHGLSDTCHFAVVYIKVQVACKQVPTREASGRGVSGIGEDTRLCRFDFD